MEKRSTSGDIWLSNTEVSKLVDEYVTRATFQSKYRDIFKRSARWNIVSCGDSPMFQWDKDSTYIRNPPFFDEIYEKPRIRSISRTRCLAKLEDLIITDHISPARAFSKNSDTGRYLMSKGVKPENFNSYGSRRVNHEVMVKGTLANVRLKNLLVPGSEGSCSVLPGRYHRHHLRDLSQVQGGQNPLIVLADKEYGIGSNRD